MSSDYKGKSGVDVKRLVQNIADQYPFKPQIAAVIELVANSLDAKASLIKIENNKEEGILSVEDDGLGMSSKRQFKEYHNFAASTKTRGEGIGFAGQGAKLALNFCKKVVSETWSSNYQGYSTWSLEGNEAPYKISDGILTLGQFGTKVTLYLDKKSAGFYTEELIKEIICEHYLPLIDPKLRDFYREIYKEGVKIQLNGEEIILDSSIFQDLLYREDIEISMYRKYRKPKVRGIFGKIKDTGVLPPGIMICTYGKVIERTYFKKEPKEKERIVGWIEAPYLIEAVTTDKCRFQAGNKLWEGFFRKAQGEFSKWLEKTGLLEKPIGKELDYTKLEQEINSILKNLPEFSFFGSRTERDVAIRDVEGEKKKMDEGIQIAPGTRVGETLGGGIAVYPGNALGKAPTTEPGEGPPAIPRPRTIRGGIKIYEDERPDLDQEAWFDGEAVTVNKSHPAYVKSKKNELLNYHLLKCVALELIKFNLEKKLEPSYREVFDLQQKIFKLWGEQ